MEVDENEYLPTIFHPVEEIIEINRQIRNCLFILSSVVLGRAAAVAEAAVVRSGQQ